MDVMLFFGGSVWMLKCFHGKLFGRGDEVNNLKCVTGRILLLSPSSYGSRAVYRMLKKCSE